MPQGVEPTSVKLMKWLGMKMPESKATGPIKYPTEDTRPLWKKIMSALTVDIPVGTVQGMLGSQPEDTSSVADWAKMAGQTAGIFPPALIGARKASMLDSLALTENKIARITHGKPELAKQLSDTLLKVYERFPRALSRTTGVAPEEWGAVRGSYNPAFSDKSATILNRNVTDPDKLSGIGKVILSTLSPNPEKTLFHELGHSAVNVPIEKYDKLGQQVGYALHPEEIGARTIAERNINPMQRSRSYLSDYLDEANRTLANELTQKLDPGKILRDFEDFGVPEINRKFAPTLKLGDREIVLLKDYIPGRRPSVGEGPVLTVRSKIPEKVPSYEEIADMYHNGVISEKEATNLVDKYYPMVGKK